MDRNTEIDISEYYSIPLSSLKLPDNYKKIIKRIMNLKNSLGDKLVVQTVGDIVELELHQFSKYQGIGKLYVDTLIEFKKELPFFLNKLEQEPNSVFEENIFTSLDNSYNFTTPIYRLALSPKYQKLIKRISSVMDNINTVQDIIDIDVVVFLKLPAVGKLYAELLINLQNALSSTQINLSSVNATDEVEELPPKITLSPAQLETPLNKLTLSTQYQRLIKRISTAMGNVNTVQDIIDIDPFYFSEIPAVGKTYVSQLIEFQKQLPIFLDAKTKKSAFFCDNYSIEFNVIDNILIEDIESYLWKLDEIRMDIALSRWGFNQQHESLEEIGKRYKVTRERIRQLEKSINLPLHLTIQPEVLWANIREKMTEDLTVLLPNLAKCFATERLFYAFLERCCQVESDSIRKIIFTKINTKIINSLFCNNPSPIAQEIIVNELISNYGYSKASAILGIKQLNKNNFIEITEQGIYPKKLGKIEAIAHVLTFYPTGLPWKDIARIVNKKNYSSTPFNEERTSASAFSDSEYTYLCAQGTYRNLIFLDLEQFNIPEIMQDLLDYFKQKQTTALHLHYYSQSKANRNEIEFYTLRHLVREYGEKYGLFFFGKSRTDSVSLDSDVKKHITQADVIIKVLNESKVAMTRQEIAERLKSKSARHASFYINNLIEEGKVVRVDKMVYTTTEKAFINMDTKAIMKIIKDIMSISNIIVESDVFREYVNMELNLSYSKYIYVALVKTQIKELAWYRNSSFFSKKPIPYNNLLDMCKQLCNPNISNIENAKILQQAVWLTDAVTTTAIHQWKIATNSLSASKLLN